MSLERIRQSNQCARARDVLGFATAPFAVADFSVAHRQLKREPWSPHVLFKRTKLRFAPRRTQQAACPRRAQLVCSGTALKSQRCLVACSCTKKPFTNFFSTKWTRFMSDSAPPKGSLNDSTAAGAPR